jgi:hypothetical protein
MNEHAEAQVDEIALELRERLARRRPPPRRRRGRLVGVQATRQDQHNCQHE